MKQADSDADTHPEGSELSKRQREEGLVIAERGAKGASWKRWSRAGV